MNKATGTTEINETLETEVERSLHELKRPAVPHPASAELEMTADDLGTLFSRMTKLSMSEVESLVDELQSLRKKLETDGDLIERAIARHSEHSQGLMQLTTVRSSACGF
jgi:hypothetical protein